MFNIFYLQNVTFLQSELVYSRKMGITLDFIVKELKNARKLCNVD